MTRYTAHATLTEEIARAVAEVPGVAFLKPGLGGLVRTTLTPDGRWAGSAAQAGVRLTRSGDGGPWRVEIHLVALRHTRTVDVARAARRAVEERMGDLFPAEASGARVSVTVTGLV
ncbi:hypothetical protein ABZ439_10205 [Streptomyces sp. NPDC005840]|uniref:Asp23/Gls24 family envelope stress response protein n=1 Tax=Streptomyces doudnae TaxID=3075536 RepID=A0ABD5ERJ3_9ACTN|nr:MULTISPECIES: hypothetical protein [unclassified Streptomyces]MDT0437326.1 hypothetical protein [Streptomyces sp. DSM 41981]MYQ66289.1 hypothetical protein [Streptomyces sp. SID4950]SCE17818.1 hypothetical protein GA0115242_124723 [Streptomyces sp. SolWspMP-5a-2]